MQRSEMIRKNGKDIGGVLRAGSCRQITDREPRKLKKKRVNRADPSQFAENQADAGPPIPG
jgi:hypothetical protein